MHKLVVSMALGAFVAGMLLADSEFRHEIEADIEPFKGLLLGLFFMAVGMSLNFDLIAAEPVAIGALVIALVVVKAAVVYALARAFGEESAPAYALAVVLSQGGEFAFVLFPSRPASSSCRPRSPTGWLRSSRSACSPRPCWSTCSTACRGASPPRPKAARRRARRTR